MKVKRNEEGAIVSLELIFIITLLVIGLTIGWVAIRNAAIAELHDIAEAVGNIDQSFYYTGTKDSFVNNGGEDMLFAATEGSFYEDTVDLNAADDTDISVKIDPGSDENTQIVVIPPNVNLSEGRVSDDTGP